MKKRNVVAENANLNLKAVKEIFNKIKANIDFTCIDSKTISVAVVSSLAGEGKTVVAANTAIAMASSGRKTLLVDADMRKSRVHTVFNTVNTRGLSDALVHDADWQEYVVGTSIPNLYLMTAGRKPPSPPRLLESQRFKTLVAEAKQEYDYVIFDAPPVLPVPDTPVLSPVMDGLVMVIRHARTRSEALKQAYDALKLANAKVIGAVINDVTRNHGSKYDYGYGYGYGYGEEDVTPVHIPKKGREKGRVAVTPYKRK